MEEAGLMSPDEIDKIVKSKEEAVGAVLLLDQIPRNIFRGKEAAKVRTDISHLLVNELLNTSCQPRSMLFELTNQGVHHI